MPKIRISSPSLEWSNDGGMYDGDTSVLPPKVVFIYKITRSYRFLEKQYCFARCFCIVKENKLYSTFRAQLDFRNLSNLLNFRKQGKLKELRSYCSQKLSETIRFCFFEYLLHLSVDE